MQLGSFQLVRLGGTIVGRARYEPGWKWSQHAGAPLGQTSCSVEHVGPVLAGRDRITMDDGRVIEVGPGDLFAVPPGHDIEVIGEEPYVSLHLLGGESCARFGTSPVGERVCPDAFRADRIRPIPALPVPNAVAGCARADREPSARLPAAPYQRYRCRALSAGRRFAARVDRRPTRTLCTVRALLVPVTGVRPLWRVSRET